MNWAGPRAATCSEPRGLKGHQTHKNIAFTELQLTLYVFKEKLQLETRWNPPKQKQKRKSKHCVKTGKHFFTPFVLAPHVHQHSPTGLCRKSQDFLGGFLKPKITDFTAAVFCLKAFLGYKMREEVKTAIKESLSLSDFFTHPIWFFLIKHIMFDHLIRTFYCCTIFTSDGLQQTFWLIWYWHFLLPFYSYRHWSVLKSLSFSALLPDNCTNFKQ